MIVSVFSFGNDLALKSVQVRRGVFPYSFASKPTRPQHTRFDAQTGGRYSETFADGSEYVIGRITAWVPPSPLAYTWRDTTWQGESSIELQFRAEDTGSLVMYQQDGFAGASVERLIPYYRVGCRPDLRGLHRPLPRLAHTASARAQRGLAL